MRKDVSITEIIRELEQVDLLPCIVFRTARSQCDKDAERAASNGARSLPIARQQAIRDAVELIIGQHGMERDLILSHPQYESLVKSGVGAHHAGQLLMWRLMLEELMSRGLLRVLVATGTVAAGVDFPARTVVITAHSRRGSEGFASLTSAELQQMSGRAGRRGKDTVGFCLAAAAPFCDARMVHKISQRCAEPLVSSYFPAPSSVLNLLRYRNVDDLQYTVERSLAAFIDSEESERLVQEAEICRAKAEDKDTSQENAKRLSKKSRRLIKKADVLRSRQVNLLETALEGLRILGYVEGSSLSEKGFWAAQLCTGLVLELSEIIADGLLDSVSAPELIAIVASIAGDSHRRYLESPSEVLSRELVDALQSVLKRVQAPGMPGVIIERKVNPSCAYTVLQWMDAKDWQQFRSLSMLGGVAEGDSARLITQTADHLNQLTRLYDFFPTLALRAEEAKRLILRPPLTESLGLTLD